MLPATGNKPMTGSLLYLERKSIVRESHLLFEQKIRHTPDRMEHIRRTGSFQFAIGGKTGINAEAVKTAQPRAFDIVHAVPDHQDISVSGSFSHPVQGLFDDIFFGGTLFIHAGADNLIEILQEVKMLQDPDDISFRFGGCDCEEPAFFAYVR